MSLSFGFPLPARTQPTGGTTPPPSNALTEDDGTSILYEDDGTTVLTEDA